MLNVWTQITEVRQREISSEKFSIEHDDEYTNGQLLRVAVYYLHAGTSNAAPLDYAGIPVGWPWAGVWWKPKSRERNLIRAGALCLAERERLLRKYPGQSVAHVDNKLNLVIEALYDYNSYEEKV
jgi:hypothetical protein